MSYQFRRWPDERRSTVSRPAGSSRRARQPCRVEERSRRRPGTKEHAFEDGGEALGDEPAEEEENRARCPVATSSVRVDEGLEGDHRAGARRWRSSCIAFGARGVASVETGFSLTALIANGASSHGASSGIATAARSRFDDTGAGEQCNARARALRRATRRASAMSNLGGAQRTLPVSSSRRRRTTMSSCAAMASCLCATCSAAEWR